MQSFELINNLNLDKGLIVLQRTNFFLENCNYSFVPLAVVIILTIVFRCCMPEKEEASTVKPVKEEKKTLEEDGEKSKDKEVVEPAS